MEPVYAIGSDDDFDRFLQEVDQALSGTPEPTKLEKTLTRFDVVEFGDKMFMNIPELKVVSELLAESEASEAELLNRLRQVARIAVREYLVNQHTLLTSGCMPNEVGTVVTVLVEPM